MDTFEQKLATGKLSESKIANWLKSKDYSVLPVYEKEINEGKGPGFFAPAGEYPAPDMLVFDRDAEQRVMWIEAKHKKVWSWYRKEERWVTGIDVHHYEGYDKVQAQSGRLVHLFFLHVEPLPSPGDLQHGCPPACPVGLFGGSLNYLQRNESHRSPNHGKGGMVYWTHERLKLLANLEEVMEI